MRFSSIVGASVAGVIAMQPLAANAACTFQVQSSRVPPLPGRLVYEVCQTNCDSSQIYFFDFQNPALGAQQIFSPDGAWINPKNPVISPDGTAVLFGATYGTSQEAEQDLYYWPIGSSNFFNLTNKSGNRDEDGKFSSDGKEVVWKRTNILGETDIVFAPLTNMNGNFGLGAETVAVSGVFQSKTEPSAPTFSPTRKYIYYFTGKKKSAKIWRYDVLGGSVMPFKQDTKTEYYYPVDADLYDFLYVSWPDPATEIDKIYLRSGFTQKGLPWNSADCADNSDPGPADEDYFFYSRNPNKKGYSLYLGQFSTRYSWSLDSLGVNTPSGDKLAANYNTAGRSWPGP